MIDLDKLSRKLDDALNKETPESLTEWMWSVVNRESKQETNMSELKLHWTKSKFGHYMGTNHEGTTMRVDPTENMYKWTVFASSYDHIEYMIQREEAGYSLLNAQLEAEAKYFELKDKGII